MLPVVAGTAFRRVDTVFEVDWTNSTPGVGSMTGTGTLYERLSSQYTVQTSPTTLSTDALFANSSSVPIGKNNTLPGLVIDENRTGVQSADWRNVGGTGWGTLGGSTITGDATTGPDGSSVADRVQTTSGNKGEFFTRSVTNTTNRVWSIWHKAGSVSATGQITYETGTATVFLAFSGTEPTNWTRASVLIPGNGSYSSNPFFVVADGSNRTGIGGLGAGARDVYVDFANNEEGNFATEAFGGATGTVTRAAPKWYRNVGSTCRAADDSLRYYIECEPKGASNEYTADMALWYVDANNRVVVDYVTQAVKATVSGTTYTTPVSASWAREDRLRFFVAVGGSALTEVQYATNASSPIRLSTGTPTTFGSITIPGALDFLQANKTNVFSVRCQKLRCYKVGKKPIDFP